MAYSYDEESFWRKILARDKTDFRAARSHVWQGKVREHRRKSGSPGCDKRKLSNFSKLWYNVESRTPTLSAILSVTAIGWKMKDEPVIKNTARAPISKISILKIAIVSGK